MFISSNNVSKSKYYFNSKQTSEFKVTSNFDFKVSSYVITINPILLNC